MFSINGKEVLVKGAVLALLADTQAAHAIGGFKVGVGFSLRQCRNCLATKDTMSTQVINWYTVIVVWPILHVAYWYLVSGKSVCS